MAKRKRARGEGTIGRASDGRWVARVSVGYRGNKRIRRAVYGQTRREVAGKLTTLLNAQQTGQLIPAGKQTVGTFLDRWLADIVRPSVRPLTYDSYETQVRVHLVPELGRIRLDQLSPQDVQSYLTRKLKSGLSPRTVQYQRTVLRRALNQATKWDLCSRNAAALTRAPHVPKTVVEPFSVAEVKTFLKAVEDEPLGPAFVVAATTGVRRAECLGLRWSDVDFERGQLRVSGALQRIEGRLQLTPTKSSRSRVVTLTTRAAEALKGHRRRQLERQLSVGKEWRNELDLVFTNSLGKGLEARTFIRCFKKVLRESGLRDLRFHDLRHGFASMLLSEGVNVKIVQELLGHSSVLVTLDTYAHFSADLQNDAVSRLDTLLGTN